MVDLPHTTKRNVLATFILPGGSRLYYWFLTHDVPRLLNSLSLIACLEKYFWLFDDDTRASREVLRSLGRTACRGDLSFSWQDASWWTKHLADWHNGKAQAKRQAESGKPRRRGFA